jgi:hypothetical protein
MTDEIKKGTVLIKEGALLPGVLVFESEPCVPGWRLVEDLNGHAFDRKIRKAGWQQTISMRRRERRSLAAKARRIR